MKIKVTDSINIEGVILEDASETFQIIDSQRAYLKEWLPWVGYVKVVEDCVTNLEGCIKRNAGGGSLDLSIKRDGKVIGRIGLHYIDKSNNKTSIGYWLSEKETGKGIMTKVVATLCNYCFEELKMNRIEIACSTNNDKSKAIPIRLGFTMEGVLRDVELVNGTYFDHCIYSKLKGDL